MAGLGNLGVAAARDRNSAAAVGPPRAARSHWPIRQRNTRRGWAGGRRPADRRNQCCRRGVRGLHRPRPSRTANAAGAPCAATACGSLGRGHGWQRPRGCCGRAHGLADRPRANCRRAGCPRNLLWNWRRDQRAPFTKAKRESAEYPVKSRFHTLTFVTPSYSPICSQAVKKFAGRHRDRKIGFLFIFLSAFPVPLRLCRAASLRSIGGSSAAWLRLSPTFDTRPGV